MAPVAQWLWVVVMFLVLVFSLDSIVQIIK